MKKVPASAAASMKKAASSVEVKKSGAKHKSASLPKEPKASKSESSSKSTATTSTLSGNKMGKLLDRELIRYFEKLADHYGISQVARGEDKAKTTDKGFLEVYAKTADAEKLASIPVRAANPAGANWKQTRDNRVAAKLAQMVKMGLPWFHKEGKLAGLPTKMHTILVMWAYSPHVGELERLKKENALKKI